MISFIIKISLIRSRALSRENLLLTKWCLVISFSLLPSLYHNIVLSIGHFEGISRSAASFPRTEATSLAEMLGKASAQAAYVAAGNTWNERQNQQTATIHTAPSTPNSRFSPSMRNPSQEPVSPPPAQAPAFGGGFHGLGNPRPSTSSMASQDLSGFREQGSMAASESTQAASSQAGHTVPHHWHRNSVFEASKQHPSMDPTASAAQAHALHKRTHGDRRQEHVQGTSKRFSHPCKYFRFCTKCLLFFLWIAQACNAEVTHHVKVHLWPRLRHHLSLRCHFAQYSTI